MTLAALAPYEREVIQRSMEATFQFFDADFETRLGISPSAMRRLLSDWPDLDDGNDDSDACLAINNAMNDLLHGVGIDDQRAKELTGTDRRGMLRIYGKWAKSRGWSSTGIR
jgi:hypothetical protein